MRFLIVGASGFVGRHLRQACRRSGYDTLGTQAHGSRPDLIAFDLERDRIEDCLPSQPTHAVVCAGITQIDRCARERDLSYRVNVTNTIRLLRDLAALDVRRVFVSTGFIFDGVTGGYAEDAPTGPVNEYGRQRLEVDQFLAREQPDALVVRLDKVIGDDPQEPSLFTEWLRAVFAQQPIRCIAGQVFCPTLVDDIARAIVTGCELELTGAYHVANPEVCSRVELAERFLQALGRQTTMEALPQERLGFAEPRPLRTYLDTTKFQSVVKLEYTTVARMLATFCARAGRDA
jgi:dTDP-4-dehydrorhamnose reductase